MLVHGALAREKVYLHGVRDRVVHLFGEPLPGRLIENNAHVGAGREAACLSAHLLERAADREERPARRQRNCPHLTDREAGPGIEHEDALNARFLAEIELQW